MSRRIVWMLLVPTVAFALLLILQGMPADAAPMMGITPTPTVPTPTSTPTKPYEIPEPSTLVLLGGGLATLWGFLQLRVRRR